MNVYDFYITPEEYAEAELNGIKPNNLEVRIRLLGWSKERAISMPLKKRTNRDKWAKVAEENGIKRCTFLKRVNKYGMTEEEAATKPLLDPSKVMREINEKRSRVIPKKWVEIGKEHGISYGTLYQRIIIQGMPFEEAATRKLLTSSEIRQLGARATKERWGKLHNLAFKKRERKC